MDKDFAAAALKYHRYPTPGKISVVPTKGLTNQRDLALAYSPGVAAACHAIVADGTQARELTARGNLVGVVTNGTAVLGLGNIGPLAAKPVMEGKGVLFKKFAGIDVFDIELAESDPDKLIDMIAALEPTLGGVNLEDIKAPECFYIESKLRDRMNIPVFHDDQHGTAIISTAALTNALSIVGKDIAQVKLVCSGAGAAAIACLNLMVTAGLRRENVIVCDSRGVIYSGREPNMEPNKARYARDTAARTLAEVMPGADVFLGLSAAGVLTAEMVQGMAERPIVLALANPTPEILPDAAKAVRPDCIIATGRSDFPNQVNNVLCFPFLFRGALDVGATRITHEMQLACVRAIADLAQAEQSDKVAKAYGVEELSFGPDYIIPKPFDPRLIIRIAPAVARAAMDSGVATRPMADFDSYRQQLMNFVYHSGLIMKPVFAAAKAAPSKRIVFAEGEDERVLRAACTIVEEGLAMPILIGRPCVVEMRVKKFALGVQPCKHFEVINPESDPRYKELWQAYYRLMSRSGITPDMAQAAMHADTTLIGVMLVKLGYADGLVCGTLGRHALHLRHVADVIGLDEGRKIFAAMNVLMLPQRTLFLCDTYVNEDPSAEDLAQITLMAAEEVRRFGVEPRVALLSHSNFGSSRSASARKMGRARDIIESLAPDLMLDGEMHGDAALSETIRGRVHPESRLKGEANLLVMPNLDAANIAYNLLKVTGGDNVTVGPILLGAARPVQILSPSATVRRLVNITALVAMDANLR